MSVKTSILMVFAGLALLTQVLTVHAQNLIPDRGSDLYPLGPTVHGVPGRPQNFARLLVRLDVVPTCTVDVGGSVSIRCTRGVPYRAWILNDADTAFGRTQVIDSRPPASNELMRIEAQRLDVEF